MATAVEVDHWRLAGRLGEIALGLGLGDGLERRVEAVDVRVVVLGVVELHDLAADVRLERAVVVCEGSASARRRGGWFLARRPVLRYAATGEIPLSSGELGATGRNLVGTDTNMVGRAASPWP